MDVTELSVHHIEGALPYELRIIVKKFEAKK